tara:strand:- start:5462 stop:7045 length:1584 start_codon:yes stop_codon:yes gene_type:complete
MIKGQVISGDFGKIIIRQKSDQKIELGELLIANTPTGKVLMQVYDLLFGSQISQQNLELMSGLKLEQETDLEFLEPELRNYNLALLKPMIFIGGKGAILCKTLPKFFSQVREITSEDLSFLSMPKKSILFGKLRSGSKTLDVNINLDGEKVFSHHILIPGTTGRGKSVLLKNILWNCVNKDYCGMLVLDPHDEYFGRNDLGLKDHTNKDKIIYYTSNKTPVGQRSLIINLKLLKPSHFRGIINLSDPQQQSLSSYYKQYKEKWIEAIILEKLLNLSYDQRTIAVVRRTIMSLLNLDLVSKQNKIVANSIFKYDYSGETTISDICNELEQGKIVIIDTSSFSGSVEILIGSMVTSEIFSKYKYYKTKDQLSSKPVISIVLEEAPRVLGKDILDRGNNIFSTIAREGRKFKIGLTAITQLPSLIPRQILANMNTKIIMGIEMQPERQAIIESSAQDLSTDNRNIASLDKGEAIITSNFSKFAIPIKIPFFDEVVKEQLQKQNKNQHKTLKQTLPNPKPQTVTDFSGINS